MDRNLTDMANEVFPAGPDQLALYPVSGQQKVLVALQQDVAAGQHLLCLTGPAGSGKTALLHALRQSFKLGLVGFIEQPTPGRLLADVAKSLQLHTVDENESSLRRRLVMLLSMVDQQTQPIIEIVDAADRLPMEDLNLLLHFFPPDHATLILAATAEPETWLAGCATSAGDAHIDRCYHLDTLSAEETASYIRHRLRMAGLPDDQFPPPTLAAIHQRSGGLPGLINQFSAAALAQSDVQSEASITITAHTPVSEPVENVQRGASDETRTVNVATAPVHERRRGDVSRARSLVAPHDVHYAAEPLPWRTRRLRRSLQLWRALAILAGSALAIVLTKDAWIDLWPPNGGSFGDLSEMLAEPAASERSVRKPALSSALDSATTSAEQPGKTGRNTDFAALHAPPLPAGTEKPLMPGPKVSGTPLPQSTITDSATPEDVRKPRSDPSDDASRPVAKADREDSNISTARPGSTRKIPSRARIQRPDIARLYAERAEYEWRNGELGAAYVSIRRGLYNDPDNPRLLEMRALLRGIMEDGRDE